MKITMSRSWAKQASKRARLIEFITTRKRERCDRWGIKQSIVMSMIMRQSARLAILSSIHPTRAQIAPCRLPFIQSFTESSVKRERTGTHLFRNPLLAILAFDSMFDDRVVREISIRLCDHVEEESKCYEVKESVQERSAKSLQHHQRIRARRQGGRTRKPLRQRHQK